MCEETKMLCPSSWMNSRKRSSSSSRTTGSSPLVASSRMSRRQSCESAAVSESFIRIPRE